MFITKLDIRNFRCFREVKIEGLGPLNFFGGHNATGKSTILDAIAFGLTGTCRGAESGRGLDELRTILDGERATSRAFVGVHFIGDQASMFQRREDEGPRAAVQKEIDKMLGITSATARACLYSGEILRIPRKEAQALLQSLLPTQTTQLPPEVTGPLLDIIGEDRKGREIDLAGIDRLHRLTYERRTDTGRDLKNFGEPRKPTKPAFLADGDDPREIRQLTGERLRSVREKRDGELLAWQQTSGRIRQASERNVSLRDELLQVEDDLANSMKTEEIRTQGTALLEQMADREETNTAIEAGLSRLRSELATHEGVVVFAQLRLAELRKLKTECPTCSTKLSPVARKSLEDSLLSSLDAAGRASQKTRLELEASTEPKPLGEITRKLSDLEAAEQKLVRLTARKAKIETAIKENQDEADQQPTPAPDTSETDARIAIGEGRISELDTYIAQLEGHSKLVAKVAFLKSQVEALDELVKALGPTGIRTSLAGTEDLASFQEGIRLDMGAMGFSVDLKPLLQMEDDPRVNGRPARFLSASEAVRFSMAFACSVAKWSNLGIVCVDAWDCLDEEATIAAGGVLATNSALQRFVFVTPKKGLEAYREAAMVRNIPGAPTRFYLLERGAEGNVVSLPVAE